MSDKCKGICKHGGCVCVYVFIDQYMKGVEMCAACNQLVTMYDNPPPHTHTPDTMLNHSLR